MTSTAPLLVPNTKGNALDVMHHQSVKYARLPSVGEEDVNEGVNGNEEAEPTFNFTSAFSYNEDPECGYKSQNNYNSAFRYRDPHVRVKVSEYIRRNQTNVLLHNA